MENQNSQARSFKERTPDSSSVEQIEYDAASMILSLTFRKNGSTYNYLKVPWHVAEAVRTSKSIGSAPRNELKGYEYEMRS